MHNRTTQKEVSKKVFVTSKGTYTAVTPEDLLGKGTYGVVYRVHNEKDPQDVKAVKTFTPETMDENEGIPPTTLREINALKVLQHPNVLKAEEIVLPQGQQALTEMFVVMELCKGTLKDKVCDMIQRSLKSDPKYFNFAPGKCPPGLRLPVVYVREAKLLAYQLLNALAYIHSRGIIHRDLKPVNVMWGFDDLLKFGDFGLARFMRGNQNSRDHVLPITGEVQTMWYRAPEVLLGDETYGAQVDDWSVGCVIAELFRFRKSMSTNRVEPEPLFNGRSDPETLLMIFETLGRPRVESDPGKAYLEKLPYWSSEFPKWDNGTLRTRVPLIDEQGLDVVARLLRVSPCERFVAKHLLDHSWFDDVRDDIAKRFQPWCVGLERGYEVMVAADRLPPAQPLIEIEKNEARRKEQEAAAAAAAAQGRSASLSQTKRSQSHPHQPISNSGQSMNKDVVMRETKYHGNGVNSSQVPNTSTLPSANSNRHHPLVSSNIATSENEHSSTIQKQGVGRSRQTKVATSRPQSQNNSALDKNTNLVRNSQQYFVASNNNANHPNDNDVESVSSVAASLLNSSNSSINTSHAPSLSSSSIIVTSTQTVMITNTHHTNNHSMQPTQSFPSKSLRSNSTTEVHPSDPNNANKCQPNSTTILPQADSLNVNQAPIDPKRTRAVARGKRSALTTTRSRRAAGNPEPRQLPTSTVAPNNNNGSVSTNLLKSINNGTSAGTWSSVSRSRSPDRGGVARRRQRVDKLPSNQSQLPFYRIPMGADQLSSTSSLSTSEHKVQPVDQNPAQHPVKPRRQITRATRGTSSTTGQLNSLSQPIIPPTTRQAIASTRASSTGR